MSIKLLRQRKLAGLIAKSPATPFNSPPVWDSQPNPVFVEGVAANYSLIDLVSDPNGDSLDVGINSGIVSLPTGVTYNTTLDQLEYDGVGAVTSSSGHIATASDGTDTTASDSFSIVISAVAASGWPAYGAHVQAGYNVSGYPTNFTTPSNYRTWNSKKDLIVAQHRYPNAVQVAQEIADTNWMRSQNANIKLQYYTFNQACDPRSGRAKYLGYEVLVEQGTLNDWNLLDFATGIGLEYSNEAVGTIPANPNYEDAGMPAGSTHANFSIAFWSKIDAKYSSQWPWDGYFYDSMDYQDAFPKYKLSTDGTTGGNPDYKSWTPSGDTDPVFYRNGMKYDIGRARSISGIDLFFSSNGGRDGTSVNEATADNEWAGFWDARLSENWQSKLGLEAFGNQFEVTFGDPDSRIDLAIGASLVSEEMVDLTASNRLGKGVVVLDFVMDWDDGVSAYPTAVNEVPQGHYEAARFIAGISMLHDSFIPAPTLTRGVYPFPYLDELVYDPGGVVGSTPSIGTIDNTIGGNRTTQGGFPLTMRAADIAPASGSTYGVYFQEFDNVLWCVNLNKPTGSGAAWPQATTDTITPPSAGSGKVWRYANSNYVNTSRTTGATACENQSPTVNTGGFVGGSFQLGRWQAIMLVRADA